MSKPNIIYWCDEVKDGKRKAHIHRMVGYCPDTLKYFKEMADELRMTFPDALDDDIICSKVRESIRYQGFTIIVWQGIVPYGPEYPGYAQCHNDKIPLEYRY